MVALAICLALYLLVAGPVLVAGLRAISREEPDALERAVTDVQRFVELRDRARAELAATGSLDRFAELKSEARAQLSRAA